MREIKFSGVRTDGTGWVYGYYLSDPETSLMPYTIYFNRKFHKVMPESVGQFTGLTDSAERDIYEGDVLRHTKYGTIGVMEWQNDGSWSRFYPLCDFEVIGNIYENKNLLK